MSDRLKTERRLLQLCVFLAAGVPVVAGTAGVIQGSHLFRVDADTAADSHIRYFSGLLLGIGLAFWWAIPTIEKRTVMVRALTFVVVCGGLSRLAAVIFVAVPNRWTLLALANEIVVAPLVCLWQARIARAAQTHA